MTSEGIGRWTKQAPSINAPGYAAKDWVGLDNSKMRCRIWSGPSSPFLHADSEKKGNDDTTVPGMVGPVECPLVPARA